MELKHISGPVIIAGGGGSEEKHQQAKDAARWRHFVEPRIMQSSEQDGFLWSLKVHLVGETKKEILDFVDAHAAMQAKGK